ncbi:hypothetical protein OF83DRAFT_517468 [Amylostereum chailletii]|nr:hypothetical protein OF83DRAFT_517468 [Amylostereum chailletii]
MDKDLGIPAAENAATSSTKSSRKGKGKAKARADDTAGRLDDPALDAELKKKILADEGLYLRILRYEVCCASFPMLCPNTVVAYRLRHLHEHSCDSQRF